MSYTHLTEQERYVISHLTIAEFSLREIARRINRHHTTVSRELKRIKSQYPYSVYWYNWTHPEALKRRRRARPYRRQRNSHLVRYVRAKLKVQWSPEEIVSGSVLIIQRMKKCESVMKQYIVGSIWMPAVVANSIRTFVEGAKDAVDRSVMALAAVFLQVEKILQNAPKL